MVTIVGYRFSSSLPKDNNQVLLNADGIDRFYVHDDQLGPYAKIGFDEKYEDYMQVRWIQNRFDLATPFCVVIPLRSVIRLKFEDLYAVVDKLNLLIIEFSKDPLKLIWDIHLTTSNCFKEDIIKNDYLNENLKLKILETCLPKYVWIIESLDKKQVLLSLVFDASDNASNLNCEHIIFYNKGFEKYFKRIKLQYQKEFEEVLEDHLKLLKKLIEYG